MDNKDFRTSLKCDNNKVKKNSLIVTCDLIGSFLQVNGNKNDAINDFIDSLCKFAKERNCQKIQFSFLSGNSVDDVKEVYEQMKDFVEGNIIIGSYGIEFLFGPQCGCDGMYLPSDNTTTLEETDTHTTKSRYIEPIINSCENYKGEFLVFDDNRFEILFINNALSREKANHYFVSTTDTKQLEFEDKIEGILIGGNTDNKESSLGKQGYINGGIKKLIEKINLKESKEH